MAGPRGVVASLRLTTERKGVYKKFNVVLVREIWRWHAMARDVTRYHALSRAVTRFVSPKGLYMTRLWLRTLRSIRS